MTIQYFIFILSCLILPPLFLSSAQAQALLPNFPPSIKIFKISSSSSAAGELVKEEIEIEPGNKTVIFSKNWEKVELHCQAPYPVRWEYMYKGKAIPVLEVKYKRLSLFNGNSFNFSIPPLLEELKEERNNGFEGVVTLRGLLQSQTGRYVCSYFNAKLFNNSYENAGHVDVFVPGNITFFEVSHIKFINKSADSSIIIPCTVTNPMERVQLYKLNDEIYRLYRLKKWKRIYTQGYDPLEGFIVEGGLGRILVGDYNCSSASTNSSIIIVVVDVSEKEKYERDHGIKGKCWENESYMKLLGSKRLECFCQDSYALFAGEGAEDRNRKANCPSGNIWKAIGIPDEITFPHRTDENDTETKPEFCLRDWRTQEFAGNGESSQELCYRDKKRESIEGTTGARFFLEVKGRKVSVNSNKLNLTVTYDGFPSWADGFKIGIKRNSSSPVEILPNESTLTQLYPLAHYRAVWNGLVLDPSEVITLHVFQPDSFSFEWFGVSQDMTKIEMEDDLQEENEGPMMVIPSMQSASSSYFTIQPICKYLITIVGTYFIMYGFQGV